MGWKDSQAGKEWRLKNKERIKGYRVKHKEKEKATGKIWRSKNKDKLMKNDEKWRQSPQGKNTKRKNGMDRRKNPIKLMELYQSNAKKRKREWDLTQEQFVELVQGKCHYCGFKPEDRLNGVDRVDNTKGYTISNCVTCCKPHNLMKGTLTKQEFTESIKRMYEYMLTDNQYEAVQFDFFEVQGCKLTGDLCVVLILLDCAFILVVGILGLISSAQWLAFWISGSIFKPVFFVGILLWIGKGWFYRLNH